MNKFVEDAWTSEHGKELVFEGSSRLVAERLEQVAHERALACFDDDIHRHTGLDLEAS